MDTDTLPQPQPITSETQCRAVLQAISALLEVDPESHSPEGRRLSALLQSVEEYEACRSGAAA
jgi:antitoxin component HigA of HigAB toxin-antitoxin module